MQASRSRTAFLLVLSVVIGRGPISGPAGGGDDPPGSGEEVALRLGPSKDSYLQGEPVQIAVGVVNNLDSKFVYNGRRTRYGLLDIKVYREERIMNKTEYYDISKNRTVSLGRRFEWINPRRSLELDIYPDLIYDMSCPGDYRVVVGIPADGAMGKSPRFIYGKPALVKIRERLGPGTF